MVKGSAKGFRIPELNIWLILVFSAASGLPSAVAAALVASKPVSQPGLVTDAYMVNDWLGCALPIHVRLTQH